MSKQKESYILVCASNKTDLWFRNGKFYCSDKDDEKKQSLNSIFHLQIRRIQLSRFRAFQRVLRLVPRCGIFADDETALVSFHGSILRINIKTGEMQEEHRFRNGMNNPLSFARIKNVPGFEDCVVYGEYFGNDGEEVRIFSRTERGNWETVYTFPENTINHIHGIVPDQQNGCIYVLTGDTDSQSAIWKITDHFSHAEKLLSGSQQYRTCVAFPYKDGLVYATDTPLQDNGIYYYNSSADQVKKIMDTEGPCIYGKKLSQDLFALSTSVEPDSRLKGWRYRLTYRRGEGVQSWYSKIYIGNPETGFKQVMQGRKDCLPMLLFGFGTFLFPDDASGKLRVVGQSIKGMDGKTITLDAGESHR